MWRSTPVLRKTAPTDDRVLSHWHSDSKCEGSGYAWAAHPCCLRVAWACLAAFGHWADRPPGQGSRPLALTGRLLAAAAASFRAVMYGRLWAWARARYIDSLCTSRAKARPQTLAGCGSKRRSRPRRRHRPGTLRSWDARGAGSPSRERPGFLAPSLVRRPMEQTPKTHLRFHANCAWPARHVPFWREAWRPRLRESAEAMGRAFLHPSGRCGSSPSTARRVPVSRFT